MNLREWWRGYTAADAASLRQRLSRHYPPDEIIWLSEGETRALAVMLSTRPVSVRKVQNGMALISVERRRCPHCGQPV